MLEEEEELTRTRGSFGFWVSGLGFRLYRVEGVCRASGL